MTTQKRYCTLYSYSLLYCYQLRKKKRGARNNDNSSCWLPSTIIARCVTTSEIWWYNSDSSANFHQHTKQQATTRFRSRSVFSRARGLRFGPLRQSLSLPPPERLFEQERPLLSLFVVHCCTYIYYIASLLLVELSLCIYFSIQSTE